MTNNNYNLISYKNIIETNLDIKKMLFNSKNQAAMAQYVLASSTDTLTLNDKAISKEFLKQIFFFYDNRNFIDLSKEPISETELLNRVNTGVVVEIKNGLDIFTFELGQENIFCTINADSEHAYYMKSSYEDFGRMSGGVEAKYKSFKDLINLAIIQAPSKLDLLQSKIDDNLNALSDKLDSPQTEAILNEYLNRMSAFHN